jgi:integrase
MGRVYQPWYRDRKTGERRYSPTWWIAYSFRGRKIRECSHSHRRQDAVNLLRKRIGEITQGRIGPQLERTSFEDLAKIIEIDYDLNARRSKARMMTSLKGLRSYFGNYLAKDITYDRLNAFVVYRLQEGLSPASVRMDLAVLRRAFRLAERSGKAVRPSFPTIQVNNVRSGFFEEDEFRLLLHHLPEEIRPMVIFGYHTGWRIRSEVMPLQWRQVDLHNGIVRLEPGTTKNDEGRQFPFGQLPELEEVLWLQRQRTNEVQAKTCTLVPWVFHRNGLPIRDFTKAWRLACTAAGIPGRIPHDFRRTAVRNLERAGVSRSAAMKLTATKRKASTVDTPSYQKQI